MTDARFTCHLCGVALSTGEHYVVRIDVFADPAMPEMTGEQLAALDPEAAMVALIEQMKEMSADELQDDVHRRFEFRVCRACQRKVLANPLGLPRRRDVGVN
jgi:hypothetical protein